MSLSLLFFLKKTNMQPRARSSKSPPQRRAGSSPRPPPWRHPCRPIGLKAEKKMSTTLHSRRPDRPLSNREGTTRSPSATNLVPTEAESARISRYTCFPSSLSPERTREKRGGEVSIRRDSRASNPHEDHILLPLLKDMRRLSEESAPGDRSAGGNHEFLIQPGRAQPLGNRRALGKRRAVSRKLSGKPVRPVLVT